MVEIYKVLFVIYVVFEINHGNDRTCDNSSEASYKNMNK